MRYRFGPFVLDTDSYQLLDGDAPIHLEPGAFDVLSFLVSHRDRVVSKNELLDSVWGDRYVSESALTSRIRDARRVLGDDGTEQRMIKTTHGRGYRFVSEVEELGPGRTASLTDAPTMEQEIRFCTSSDGVRLAYATVGSGPVLVRAAHWLTHVDYDWRSPVWHHWLTGIGAHRTLVRYDERGCGLSDHDMVDCSLDAWVDDLKSVADDFRSRPVPRSGGVAGRTGRDGVRLALPGTSVEAGALEHVSAGAGGSGEEPRRSRGCRDPVRPHPARLGT